MSAKNKRAIGMPAKDEHVSLDNHLDAVGAYLRVFDAYLRLTAAIDRSGFDVSPCRNCGEPVVCIPDGLAMCRDCAEKAWYFEDDLPSDYDYQANFDRSRVIDGVRMFPSIPKAAKEG